MGAGPLGRISVSRIKGILDRSEQARVLVVGDLMLDRYVWGKALRISQEAPVPIVAVKNTTFAPGGAANVLRNLAALDAAPLAFGVPGQDPSGDALPPRPAEPSVKTAAILPDPTRRPPEKTRPRPPAPVVSNPWKIAGCFPWRVFKPGCFPRPNITVRAMSRFLLRTPTRTSAMR